MKRILNLVLTLMVNFISGGVLSSAAGASFLAGGFALMVFSLLPLRAIGCSCVCATMYTEVWTGEMIKAFRTSLESIGWLNKIRSYDQYVENSLIHFVALGGDPDVLLNNYTYPLSVQGLTDTDKAISLDKYETRPSRVTDDELYAISYDKMASVIERHKEVIDEKRFTRAIWNLAPAANTAGATPVIKTTGAVTGVRKTLVTADLITLKGEFDKMKVPVSGRMLVLCSDHVNDLLGNDQKFASQYYNYATGKISNLYGFEVYEYNDTPYYTVSSLARLAFGSAPAATDRQASVAFYAPRMMKAKGMTKTYLSEAKDNPTTKENLISFTDYFICLPLKNEAIAAIVSDVKPS
jgi:hypothetical protein